MRKTDTSINLNQPVSKYGRHQSTVLNLGISYSQTVNSNFFNCCRIPKTPLIRKQVWINSTLLLWTKNATAPGSPKSTRSTDKLVVGELAGVYCKSKGKVGVNVVTIHDCCVLRSCQRSLSPSYLFRAFIWVCVRFQVCVPGGPCGLCCGRLRSKGGWEHGSTMINTRYRPVGKSNKAQTTPGKVYSIEMYSQGFVDFSFARNLNLLC